MKESKGVTEALGKNAAVLLLVFNKSYDVKNARILVRVGHESPRNDGVVFATMFREENSIVRLSECRRYAAPVRLNTGYKTTFVELVDTATDTSCVFMGRHREYANPYEVKKVKETVVEVAMPVVKESANFREKDEADAEVLNFLSSVAKIADVTEKHYERENRPDVYVVKEGERDVLTDPISEIECQYKSGKPVFMENDQATMITGVYWCNERHWKICNNDLLAAPLTDSLYPINAASSMPILLRQLHMRFVDSIMNTSVVYDYTLPSSISDRVNFPHLMPLESNILNDLYPGVVQQVVGALSLVYRDISFSALRVNFTDFNESSVLITREGLYNTKGLDVSRNPFNPWTNEFVCKRWNLKEYTNHRLYMGETLPLIRETKSPWCKFIVRDGLIEGVKHATGQTYGDINYDLTPMQTLRVQLNKLSEASWMQFDLDDITSKEVQSSIDEMILKGLGHHPAIVCYTNTDDGHLYISHPLFPPGKCIAFLPPLLSYHELQLLIEVHRASESLYRYCITKI